MSATFDTREVDDVTVVDVVGRVTLGEGSSGLRDLIRDLISKDKRWILLNMRETSYVDSTGICQLVCSFIKLSDLGGHLKFLALTKKVRDLLQITKLYTVFEVYDDEPLDTFEVGQLELMD